MADGISARGAGNGASCETARRYERRAEEVETEGYDRVSAAPRTRLALLRGEMDEVERLEPINLGRIQHEYLCRRRRRASTRSRR